MKHNEHIENPDVILVGSGVMSANLGAMLKRLEPKLRIQVYETTDMPAQESSNGWNNAGTGHAGICELSYTPHREADGTVKVAKAIEIFEQFERTKQFWSYAVAEGMISDPKAFINPVPHISFVHTQEQVDYLKARYEGLKAHHFFDSMAYTTSPDTIRSWAPLLLDGRDPAVPVAATKMDGGTDVNYGELSRKLLEWLATQPGCGIATGHRVTDLKREGAGWKVAVRDTATGGTRTNSAKYVFVGAGGGSLPLLQKAGISEVDGMGGFPIGGQWLVCDNPEIVAKHRAKVYGQALGAAPTMAVPHLDTRILDGKKTLLFGPYASWTTKFLNKTGSAFDLPGSIRPANLVTLTRIGLSNFSLVRYLMQQGTQRMADRMKALHVFYPAAKQSDWRLIDAGIRVQAIKKTDGKAGIVHYGTEIISDKAKSITALMGASPGASVSVHIALNIVKDCFPKLLATPEGRARMKAMIPSWDVDAKAPENAAFFREWRDKAEKTLELV